MDSESFTQSLQEQQFNEVLEKSLGAIQHNATHSHPFDVRTPVTQGTIKLTVEGVTTQYNEGEIVTMVAGCTHAENVGANGVTYPVGRHYG